MKETLLQVGDEIAKDINAVTETSVGTHYCADWDYALIKPGSQMFECCTCFSEEDRNHIMKAHDNDKRTTY